MARINRGKAGFSETQPLMETKDSAYLMTRFEAVCEEIIGYCDHVQEREVRQAIAAHEALVAALRSLLAEVDDSSYGPHFLRAVKPQEAIDEARTALALVGEDK